MRGYVCRRTSSSTVVGRIVAAVAISRWIACGGVCRVSRRHLRWCVCVSVGVKSSGVMTVSRWVVGRKDVQDVRVRNVRQVIRDATFLVFRLGHMPPQRSRLNGLKKAKFYQQNFSIFLQNSTNRLSTARMSPSVLPKVY